MAQEKGLVLVYTGDGKGKTTAALGLGLRAWGHHRRVLVLQFMKGPGNVYGELHAAERMPGFDIVQGGRDSFVDAESPAMEDRELAEKTLEGAHRVLQDGEYDLVILDEANVAVDFGLISEEKLLEAIEGRKPAIDVVITGRNASSKLQEVADLVSEVREIKHHYRQGIQARAGIEH